ncbi:Choline dehydrogenase [Mycena venus]|uniref:Choline dehydrogenase n=1 Tax=Mycena venus TaxID=2733690 RepID=A0A8H7CXB6_9AGAR|nr:Choline dehydrogenase [Mycena venus]
MQPCIAIAAVALLSFARAALQSCPDLTHATDVFDFVVVGSGAGGGPLASRLAENGFSVFLVDAGNDVNTFNTTLPAYFARATEDEATELAYNINEFSYPDSRIAWYPRARALGGSTIHNAMINIIAGTKTDFNDIATKFKDQSWSRRNMQKYFQKIEKNLYILPTLLTLGDHGFTGWLKTTLLPYLNLLHNLNVVDPQLLTIFGSLTLSPSTLLSNPPILDLNSVANDDSVGVNTPSFTIDENHVRSSVYNRLTAVHGSTSKLNITLNTLATKILLCQGSDGLPTAYGVEIAPDAALPVAGKFPRQTGSQSAHRYGTPRSYCFCRCFPKSAARGSLIHFIRISTFVKVPYQLMQLSGIGNSAELSEFGIETVVDLPGVGTNLQDHDEIAVVWKLKDDFKLLKGCTFLSNTTQDPCLKDWIQSDHKNGYSFNPVLAVFINKSKESLEAPDMFTYVAPAYFEGIFRGFSQQIADNPNALTAIVLRAHPSSRGFVKLTGPHPQDPLNIAKLHFEADDGPEDMKTLADGINRIRSLVKNSLINDFIVEEALPGSGANLTEYLLERVFGHHACCTNPIGKDGDPNAVLDNEFRVHGVNRLRVVDMSSWPNVPGYFVTTPTYMISEKAADVIIAAARAPKSR